MENREIFIPLLSWLIGGSRIGGSYNIYCGSLGTDPFKGFMDKKLFNYRIWIEKIEEEEYIKVCCYSGYTSFDNQNEDDLKIETFSLSEESREEIKAYIQKEMNDYLG